MFFALGGKHSWIEVLVMSESAELMVVLVKGLNTKKLNN